MDFRKQDQDRQHRRVIGQAYAGGIAVVVALWLVITQASLATAAIELVYRRATPSATSVLLEWGTRSEVNFAAFEIQCKGIDEPDTAYHTIGTRFAQGGPGIPANYSFNVTTGLVPGKRYCFRIVERTTDGLPGEKFDLCGYGLNLLPVQGAAGAESTPTPIPLEQPPGLDPAPTLQPTSPVATPSAVPWQPTPTMPPQDEGAQIAQQDSPDSDGFADTATVPDGYPAPDATQEQWTEPTPTETPTEFPTPTETPTEFPTATPTPTPTFQIAEEPDADGGAAIAQEEGTPTPIYIVVTATPTPEALALVPPALTPWPTATPAPAQGLSELLVPNTQNLMVLLLCLIFLSASGLGALGLITSILYMRSQIRRERYYLPPPYGRRRY